MGTVPGRTPGRAPDAVTFRPEIVGSWRARRPLWNRGHMGATIEVVWPDGRVTPADAGPFEITAQWGPPSATGRQRVRLRVEHRGAAEQAAGIRFAVPLPERGDPWWLVPGAFYGENRPAGGRRIFPRFAAGAADPAAMISDRWEFRA